MSPFLVAITGGSGSGKSTLAQAFVNYVGDDQCIVIGEDNYYKPRGAHRQNVVGMAPAEVEKLINFDDIEAKDMERMHQDFLKLKKGEIIHQPVYSFADHDRVDGQHDAISPRPILVVEGIHVLSRPETADLFDLKVFVDTPPDLRLARRILRDSIPEEEGGRGRSPDRVIAQYLQFVRASHYQVTEPSKYICDLVIADEGLPAYREIEAEPTERAINRMLTPLVNRIRIDRPDLISL